MGYWVLEVVLPEKYIIIHRVPITFLLLIFIEIITIKEKYKRNMNTLTDYCAVTEIRERSLFMIFWSKNLIHPPPPIFSVGKWIPRAIPPPSTHK